MVFHRSFALFSFLSAVSATEVAGAEAVEQCAEVEEEEGSSMLTTNFRERHDLAGTEDGIGKRCVDGDAHECHGKDMEWNFMMGKCCVPATWTCTCGKADECRANHNLVWTGKECCARRPSQCVQGMKRYCNCHGMDWTGKLCCVDKLSTCSAGSMVPCRDSGGLWTGTYCCVHGVQQCLAGIKSQCKHAHFTWTGSQCCLPKHEWNCAAGTIGGCKGHGKKWTGTLCCAQHKQCVPGLANSCKACKGHDVTFTGTSCCVPKDMTCVAGTIGDCKGIGKIWTGIMCCTQGLGNQCFASAQCDCSGHGAMFTGSQCCVPAFWHCENSSRDSCKKKFGTRAGHKCCFPMTSHHALPLH